MIEFCSTLQDCQNHFSKDATAPLQTALLEHVRSFVLFGGLDASGVVMTSAMFRGDRFIHRSIDILDSVRRLGVWLDTLKAHCPSTLVSSPHAGVFSIDEFDAPVGRLYGCVAALFTQRAPHWSQLQWCDPQTRRTDLEMFFERVVANTGNLYVLIAPNTLAQQHWDYVSSQLSRLTRRGDDRDAVRLANLAIVFTKDCSLKRMCSQSSLAYAGAIAAPPLFTALRATIRLTSFYGQSGDGKTFAMSRFAVPAPARKGYRYRVNEGFSVSGLVEEWSNPAEGSLVHSLSTGQPVTLFFHVSAYAAFGILDSFLFRLLVLGCVSSSRSGRVLVLPPTADVLVVIEIPTPVSVHDVVADQRPNLLLQSRAVLREGTVGDARVADQQANALTIVCPCEACVAKVPGYKREEGCGHMLPALLCIASDKKFVRRDERFEGENARFKLALRMLNAFFPAGAGRVEECHHRPAGSSPRSVPAGCYH